MGRISEDEKKERMELLRRFSQAKTQEIELKDQIKREKQEQTLLEGGLGGKDLNRDAVPIIQKLVKSYDNISELRGKLPGLLADFEKVIDATLAAAQANMEEVLLNDVHRMNQSDVEGKVDIYKTYKPPQE